jgi:hypothetical protein
MTRLSDFSTTIPKNLTYKTNAFYASTNKARTIRRLLPISRKKMNYFLEPTNQLGWHADNLSGHSFLKPNEKSCLLMGSMFLYVFDDIFVWTNANT